MRLVLLALWWILELYEPLKKRPLLVQVCRVYLANSEAVQTTQETRDTEAAYLSCGSFLWGEEHYSNVNLFRWALWGPQNVTSLQLPLASSSKVWAALLIETPCTLIQAFLFYMTYFSNGTERGNYKCMFKATRIFKFSLFLSCIF